MLTTITVVALLFAGSPEACTYDEWDQLKKLQVLVEAVDGGEYRESEKEVRWKDSNGRSLSVVYGGCDHLGFKISRSGPRGAKLSESEIFEAAVELAKIPSWSTEAVVLARAVESKSFTRAEFADGVRYDILNTEYTEMYVELERSKEDSVLSFGWVRDF